IMLATGRKLYSVQPGSVWVRSNLLAPAVAGNLYTGFSIKAGELQFSEAVTIGGDKIEVPANVIVSIKLDLEQPLVSDVSPDQHGIDVRNSSLQLPAAFAMQFSTAGGHIVAVADAS